MIVTEAIYEVRESHNCAWTFETHFTNQKSKWKDPVRVCILFQDGLDQYERYVEYPRHSDFFTSIVRGVVTDTRHTVVLNDLELQAVLQDFSTIQ